MKRQNGMSDKEARFENGGDKTGNLGNSGKFELKTRFCRYFNLNHT